jgi:pimeloyl-ACP methyl ester carboxylesterase
VAGRGALTPGRRGPAGAGSLQRMDRHWPPAGAPVGAITLLHGIASTAASFWKVGPMLAARGWEVTALDLPGHGDAVAPARPLSLRSLADDVAARLPERVDVLAGHSLGAVTATAIAAWYPGRVGALVLEDPPGNGGAAGLELAEQLAADTATARTDPEAVARREREGNPTWAPEDVAYSVDGMAALDVPWVTAGLRGDLTWDLPAQLGEVGVPVLVLVAPDTDRSLDWRRSALFGPARQAVAALVPADRFVVMDSSHCLHRDHPDAWVEAVATFARSLP